MNRRRRADGVVGLAAGEALGACVDARRSSPTFSAVVTVSVAPGGRMLVPAGMCNGFQATSREGCLYLYCLSEEWTPGMSGVAVNPLDPALGIAWPVAVDAADPASVSAKDAAAPLFAELAASAD